MNIGIHVDDRVIPNWGGGYSYVERVVDGLLKLNGKDGLNYFILHEQFSPSYVPLAYPTIQLPRYSFFQQKPGIRKAHRYATHLGIIQHPQKKYLNYVDKTLEKYNIDLVYHPHQHQYLTYNTPFVVTNWDLAHITTFPFPEISSGFNSRDSWYRTTFQRAFCVFAESEAGKNEIIKHLNFPESKIRVIPIFPGRVTNISISPEEMDATLIELKLNDVQYFLYPAQFWTVKNHYTLVKAFEVFHNTISSNVKLVFTGSDKGTKEHIKKFVSNLNLDKHILFLDFVSDAELNVLYRNAISLVMPTLLGPTNIPPLEAIALKCPVICSDMPGHREQLGDAVLFINPLDKIDIARAMKIFYENSNIRKKYSEKGYTHFQNSSLFKLDIALNKLHTSFIELTGLLKLWKETY